MVELKTIGGELPEVPVEDIAPENVLKVQVSIAGTECHISLIPKISVLNMPLKITVTFLF